MKLHAVLRINVDYSDAINTNCTIASVFIILSFVMFSPWTIADFVSVNFVMYIILPVLKILHTLL